MNQTPEQIPRYKFDKQLIASGWLWKGKTLGKNVHYIPVLRPYHIHNCQMAASANLKKLYKDKWLRSLKQSANGGDLTFITITFIYLLLKYAEAKQVLFLVNIKNLGEQAKQEFKRFRPHYNYWLFAARYIVTFKEPRSIAAPAAKYNKDHIVVFNSIGEGKARIPVAIFIA